MPIRQRGKTYTVDVQVSGVRVRATAQTRKKAKELETRIRQRLYDDLHSAKMGRAPKRTLAEALLRWIDNDCPSLKSCKKFESHIRNMLPYVNGVWLSESLEALEQMKQAMLAEGLKPATINRRLAIGRRILNIAYKQWSWLNEPLGDKVQLLPEHNNRHVYLTPKQVNALAKACYDPNAGKMVKLAAYTGLRRSELLSLTADNVRDGRIILGVQTKSGRPRVVPIPKEIMALAKQIPVPITDGQLRKNWDHARDETGIHVRFHDLRHTYASWLIQTGAPLTAVRDLLGHANLSVTDRYSHLADDHLQDAVSRLNRVSRQKRAKVR